MFLTPLLILSHHCPFFLFLYLKKRSYANTSFIILRFSYLQVPVLFLFTLFTKRLTKWMAVSLNHQWLPIVMVPPAGFMVLRVSYPGSTEASVRILACLTELSFLQISLACLLFFWLCDIPVQLSLHIILCLFLVSISILRESSISDFCFGPG